MGVFWVLGELPDVSWTQFGVAGSIALVFAIAIVCFFKYGMKKPGEPTSGELSPEYWNKIFTHLQASIDDVDKEVHDLGLRTDNNLSRVSSDLTAIRSRIHDIADSLHEVSIRSEMTQEARATLSAKIDSILARLNAIER